ncbi:MAG: hypothetical protein R3266_04550, partial [Gemmatimonadota bacterium]|nr:hypothetical protein [Gemmatimonadota bacterium]
EAYDEVRDVLEENRALLERIAEALLERETLDADDIKLLDQGKELPPPPAVEAPAPTPEPAVAEPAARDRPIEGTGGEPAPAPA